MEKRRGKLESDLGDPLLALGEKLLESRYFFKGTAILLWVSQELHSFNSHLKLLRLLCCSCVLSTQSNFRCADQWSMCRVVVIASLVWAGNGQCISAISAKPRSKLVKAGES